jgi:hypothetical protein
MRYRPCLQNLEDRTLLTTVTNLEDIGLFGAIVPGSLRDALVSTSAGGSIDFEPGLTGTINLNGGILPIVRDVTIAGPGPNSLTIDGGGTNLFDGTEVFVVNTGVNATISGLSIRDGRAPAGAGGGAIFNRGTLSLINTTLFFNFAAAGGAGDGVGGAIYNAGSLNVVNSYLDHNQADGTTPSGTFGQAAGGGIFNIGNLTVDHSTIGDNFAVNGSGALGSVGGGIYSTGIVTILNSTVGNNDAVGNNFPGWSGAASGGGIYSTGTLTAIGVTVADNIAIPASGLAGTGGGVFTAGSNDVFKNSIVARNYTTSSGPDIQGLLLQAIANVVGVDGGNNVMNGVSGNQVGTSAAPLDPRLGALQSNGGPTPTMALQAGSPALGKGDVASAYGSTDQRGLPRIVNGAVDVGAFQVQAAVKIFALGGNNGRVQVRRVSDGSLITEFAPYPGYTGGVSVAVGDVAHDGFPDLVTGATVGNPNVKVFKGFNFQNNLFDPNNPDASVLVSFFPYALSFNVGANVAVGDIENDGFADIVTGATAGNPDVRVYSSKDIAQGTFDPNGHSLRAQWFPYALQFNVGANVAAGDIEHDGFADVVTGATAGNPDVRVYSGKDIAQGTFDPTGASLRAQLFPFALQFNVGAFVAVGDVNADGFADLITGASIGNPQVNIYSGQAIAAGTFDPTTSQLATFFAFQLGTNTGVSVASAGFTNTGQFQVLTGQTTGGANYRVVNGLSSGVLPPALFEGMVPTLGDGLDVGA